MITLNIEPPPPPGGPILPSRVARVNERARHSAGKTFLRAHKLTKFYGDQPGVSELDFEVHEAEVFGFLPERFSPRSEPWPHCSPR